MAKTTETPSFGSELGLNHSCDGGIEAMARAQRSKNLMY
jgi:hypothetical protein